MCKLSTVTVYGTMATVAESGKLTVRSLMAREEMLAVCPVS